MSFGGCCEGGGFGGVVEEECVWERDFVKAWKERGNDGKKEKDNPKNKSNNFMIKKTKTKTKQNNNDLSKRWHQFIPFL